MTALLAIGLVLVILILLHHLATKNYGYWEKKKVPYAKPVPLFGNYKDYILLKKYHAFVCQDLCQQFPDEPYFGTYYGTQPALVVKDPELMKLVLTKDFYYFNSRELMDYSKCEVITQNMFFSYGDRWKIVRQNLTPLFSTVKMKNMYFLPRYATNMFYLVEKCAFMLEDLLDYEASMSGVLSARTLSVRYTMDCICSCVFGVEGGSLARDATKNPFTAMGHLIFSRSYIRGIGTYVRSMWPQTFYGLKLKIFPPSIDKFFHDLVTGVFESRQHKPSPRNDFVDALLSFKTNNCLVGDSITNMKTGENKKINLEVDDALLISQCVLFFAAGFETSASFTSLTLYELAKDQLAQTRAQKEVDEYLKRHKNKLNYGCVSELPFLNACVSESIRLYAILGVLTREAVEDYTFPSGLQVEKGLRIHLPVHHIHHDPKNFPEPEKFKPERFLPEAADEIKPYTYFPFGEGPRTCIGMRFGKMQMMPGLITFLKQYKLELAEGTPSSLSFESTTVLLQPTSTLGLKVTPRHGWEDRRFVN